LFNLSKHLAEEEFDNLPNIKQLVEDIRLPNKIERYKEEEFVIRSFLSHGNVSKIIRDLKDKHPDTTFTSKDINEFMYEYKDAIKYQNNLNRKQALNRVMKTREGLTNELLDLATLSKTLAVKYDSEGDNTSAISAIKAAADIFFRNAKLEGILDEKPQVNVNVAMDKMVLDAVTEESSFSNNLQDYIRKTQVVDADFEEVDDGE